MDADSARTRPTDAQVIANAPASEVSIHQLHVPLVDLRAQSLVVRDRLDRGIGIQGRPVDIVQRIDPGLHFSY